MAKRDYRKDITKILKELEDLGYTVNMDPFYKTYNVGDKSYAFSDKDIWSVLDSISNWSKRLNFNQDDFDKWLKNSISSRLSTNLDVFNVERLYRLKYPNLRLSANLFGNFYVHGTHDFTNYTDMLDAMVGIDNKAAAEKEEITKQYKKDKERNELWLRLIDELKRKRSEEYFADLHKKVPTDNSSPRWSQIANEWIDQTDNNVKNTVQTLGSRYQQAALTLHQEKVEEFGRNVGEPVKVVTVATAMINPSLMVVPFIAGEAVNIGTNYASDGKYKTWGALVSNNGEWFPQIFGEATNPGFYAKNLSKQVQNGIGRAVEWGYNNGILGDEYTTFGGRFGYWGNTPYERIVGTYSRQLGLPTTAEMPELIRLEKGKIGFPIGENISGRFPWGNFTTGQPVIKHRNGSWNGSDAIIYNPKVVNPKLYLSIEPMDTYVVGVTPTNTNLMVVVSGNPEILTTARKFGYETLSSKRLRKLEMLIQKKTETDPFFHVDKSTESALHTKELDRLIGTRGRPTSNDYLFLADMTGLTSPGVNRYLLPIKTINGRQIYYNFNSKPSIEYDFRKSIGMDNKGNYTPGHEPLSTLEIIANGRQYFNEWLKLKLDNSK